MDVHKKSWTAHFKTDLFDNKKVTTGYVRESGTRHCERSEAELISDISMRVCSEASIAGPLVTSSVSVFRQCVCHFTLQEHS